MYCLFSFHPLNFTFFNEVGNDKKSYKQFFIFLICCDLF